MTLKAEDMLFQRDDEGKLIPVEVSLGEKFNNAKIKVKPLTRGRLQKILAGAKSEDPDKVTESDELVIKEGLIEPELSDEQRKYIKPPYATEIVTSILSVSLGMSKEELEEKMQNTSKSELVGTQEEEVKKK